MVCVPMSDELVERRQVIIWEKAGASRSAVRLVREAPLTLFLDGEELVTLLCTGQHPEDLAVGFLRSEGIIDSWEEVSSLKADDEAGTVSVGLRGQRRMRKELLLRRTLGAGCGRASLYYQPLDGMQIRPVGPGPKLQIERIQLLMREMNLKGALYREARATHAAGLANERELVLFREDIGRHNAVDMIVGHAMRTGISLEDKLLLTTGRASSEIVLKAARVGIPVVASRSAATALGVRLAQEVGMTLVGSVRGGRMTVYCHAERLGL